MPRRNALLALPLAALLVLASALSSAAAAPKTKTLHFKKGLSAPATIKIDNYGVPHIEAQTDADAWFLAGWIQAKDRLVEMDGSRRIAEGRIAEIAGKEWLEDDIEQVKRGIPMALDAIWENATPLSRSAGENFAAGVNAYIDEMKISDHPEYAMFGAKPEKWTPVDSLSIGRQMSWRLSSDLGSESAQAAMLARLGPALYDELTAFQGVRPLSIVTWKEMQASLLPMGDAFERLARKFNDPSGIRGDLDPLTGSNNWVVSGKRSKSGVPLLANDPHLSLLNPSIWYEMQLKTPTMNVIGATFPGVPAILIGHNEKIAWGVTTAGFDVSDLYIETPDPDQPDTHYMFRGESRPYEVKSFDFKYRDGAEMKTETVEFRYTVHGPVMEFEPEKGQVVSFKWTGHEPTYEIESFLEINRAQNLDDFKNALTHFDVGAQSFVYADVDGNIYYQSAGKVPIRKGVPYLPLDGASGDFEWTGYIPRDELPQVANPDRGFVATANNLPVDESYPYYIGAFFSRGLRAKRITDRILEKPKLTLKDMQSIQADNYSELAAVFLPEFLKAVDAAGIPNHPMAKRAVEILKKWDLHTDVDSVGCSIFHKWLKHAVKAVFYDEFDPPVGEAEWLYKQMFIAHPAQAAFWFDDKTTEKKETREEPLAAALAPALDELTKMLGNDIESWRWGRIHHLKIQQILNPAGGFGPFEQDGSIGTVDNASFSLLGDNYDYGHGPSIRFVAEMNKNGIVAENVLPGGQSSSSQSRHFKDQLDLWLTNKARPQRFYEAELKKNVEVVLDCRPSDN